MTILCSATIHHLVLKIKSLWCYLTQKIDGLAADLQPPRLAINLNLRPTKKFRKILGKPDRPITEVCGISKILRQVLWSAKSINNFLAEG